MKTTTYYLFTVGGWPEIVQLRKAPEYGTGRVLVGEYSDVAALIRDFDELHRRAMKRDEVSHGRGPARKPPTPDP